jgi:DNA (cytosine-5)-methyltransferase 1
MRHGSLFSGIGGFDLAAQWMNWTNVFHTEWNEFGQKILQHHFPQSISYHDIIKTDFTIHNGDIDIITGGFPCQPFSNAGKRKGTDDERYLWHEMLRAIQQIRPTYVVAENVRGLLTIDGGMVFEQVCADLEAEGYEVQPILLPAAGVNAPHRRDRIFIVGYAANTIVNRNTSQGPSEETKGNRSKDNRQQKYRGKQTKRIDGLHGFSRDAANTNLRRLERSEAEGWNSKHVEWTGSIGSAANANIGLAQSTQTGCEREECKPYNRNDIWNSPGSSQAGLLQRQRHRCQDKGSIGRCRKESHQQSSRCICTGWQNFPTESAICGRDDGLSNRLDNITFPKWRNESIKAYGNAVVPQLILPIFQTIEKLHREKK